MNINQDISSTGRDIRGKLLLLASLEDTLSGTVNDTYSCEMPESTLGFMFNN